MHPKKIESVDSYFFLFKKFDFFNYNLEILTSLRFIFIQFAQYLIY